MRCLGSAWRVKFLWAQLHLIHFKTAKAATLLFLIIALNVTVGTTQLLISLNTLE